MKTYILITLAVLSFASVHTLSIYPDLTQNVPYLLATVLFYNDGKGHQIVAAGLIPRKVKTAIREDIIEHYGHITDVIVPLFHNMADVPAPSDIADLMHAKSEHSIYVVDIPKWLASNVVRVKSKKMHLRNMKNYRLDDLAKDAHINDEAVNTNSISEGKFDETSINNTAKVPKTYYMPNTVIYGVETKCNTPTEYSCNLYKKSRHIKDLDYKTFKSVFATMKTSFEETETDSIEF